jgi:hypothetical protein
VDLGVRDAAMCVAGGTRDMGGRSPNLPGVLGRDTTALVETATALLAAGAPDAVALATDLTAPDAVTAAFTELGEWWGCAQRASERRGAGHAAGALVRDPR